MSTDTLCEYLHRVPFHPIDLFLPSGRVVTITNPGLAMFNESGRVLGVFQGERLILVDVATAEANETAVGE